MATSITAFPGRYIQGPGVLRSASGEIRKYGIKALIVIDPFVAETIWPQYSQWFEDLELEVNIFGGECCEDEIAKVTQKANLSGSTIIVAMGGGKTIDTAKAAADQTGLPAFIIPTAASSDAPCSAVAVVYTPEGEVQKVLKIRNNPSIVLMDTEIIVKAPVRLLTAGMGDALATWFEADSAYNTNSSNVLGSCASRTAYRLARLCYETIAEYGALAIEACEAGCITPALEYVVEANTLLSGIGFESGGLAAAHGIHNALSVLPGSHHALHGEKVALGLLASLFLTGKPPRMIDDMYILFNTLHLPTTFTGLGMNNLTADDLLAVGKDCCLPGNNIHHEPVTVTPERVRDALLMADYHGRYLIK